MHAGSTYCVNLYFEFEKRQSLCCARKVGNIGSRSLMKPRKHSKRCIFPFFRKSRFDVINNFEKLSLTLWKNAVCVHVCWNIFLFLSASSPVKATFARMRVYWNIGFIDWWSRFVKSFYCQIFEGYNRVSVIRYQNS